MDRARYKSDAKEAFKRNYWACVVVSLILFLFCTSHNNGGNSSRNNRNSYPYQPGYQPGQSQYYQSPGNNQSYNQIMQMLNSRSSFEAEGSGTEVITKDATDLSGSGIASIPVRALSYIRFLYRLLGTNSGLKAMMGFLVIFVIVLVVLAFVLDAFVFSPLDVGGRKFYIENAFGDNPRISRIGYAFGCGHYLNIVAAMFVKKFLLSIMFLPFAAGMVLLGFFMASTNVIYLIIGLVLTLLGLVLLIPETFLHYSWRLIAYVLADDPSLSPMAALKESNRIMSGYRFESFILDLTFILWDILASVTIYIAGIFWVYPYKDATYAEMYLDLAGNSSTAAPTVKAPRRDDPFNDNDSDYFSGSDW